MQQFPFVLKEMRKWLAGFEWVNVLMPFDLVILFASLALMLMCSVFELFQGYSALIIAINSICYFTFLLGVLLTLISHNIKFLPYGLWIYAFIVLFPFTHFYTGGILRAALYAYLGYELFRFTVMTNNYTEY